MLTGLGIVSTLCGMKLMSVQANNSPEIRTLVVDAVGMAIRWRRTNTRPCNDPQKDPIASLLYTDQNFISLTIYLNNTVDMNHIKITQKLETGDVQAFVSLLLAGAALKLLWIRLAR